MGQCIIARRGVGQVVDFEAMSMSSGSGAESFSQATKLTEGRGSFYAWGYAQKYGQSQKFYVASNSIQDGGSLSISQSGNILTIDITGSSLAKLYVCITKDFY